MDRGDFEPREPFLAAATLLGMEIMPHTMFQTRKLFDSEFRDCMGNEVLSVALLYKKIR
jgi:hypothetical protein